MKTIRIQNEAFDANLEIAALSAGDAVGAIVTFTGVVRGDDGVTALRLEHYPGMTEREIARHIDDAFARWPLSGATVIHRIGELKTGAPIVFVAAASSHRRAAFEAAAFLMDYLKTRAPFWKEERRGNDSIWVESRASDGELAKRWE